MPVQVREFQETPNPNALKCILADAADGKSAAGVRSYRQAPSSGTPEDPLAGALFAIPGVVGVLIADGWITINKAPETPWSAIKPAVKATLGRFEHTGTNG